MLAEISRWRRSVAWENTQLMAPSIPSITTDGCAVLPATIWHTAAYDVLDLGACPPGALIIIRITCILNLVDTTLDGGRGCGRILGPHPCVV